MKRREFIGLVGGAVAWPAAAGAQQLGKVYRIGVFSAGSPPLTPTFTAFPNALSALGWIEGQNILLENRFADNRLEHLPELAAELVRLKVDIIVTYGTLAPLAAKRATSTIPIVMCDAGDPVASRLVVSLARPGGNVTGLSLMSPDLAPKRVQMLKELLPALSRVAVLWNAANPYPARVFKETVSAAKSLGIEVDSIQVRGSADFDDAFNLLMKRRPDALIAVEDPLIGAHRKQITDYAVKSRLPSMYGLREYADAGGLMSYGPNLVELRRRAAGYVDQIIKGAKPADMPIQQPTKFEMIINLNTAKALGLTVPPSLLARADEMIE
jgi:putative ABC transport system substrate-binding protein